MTCYAPECSKSFLIFATVAGSASAVSLLAIFLVALLPPTQSYKTLLGLLGSAGLFSLTAYVAGRQLCGGSCGVSAASQPLLPV